MLFLPSASHSALIQNWLRRMSTTFYGRSMLRRCCACNAVKKQFLMNYFPFPAPSLSPRPCPTTMNPLSTSIRYVVPANYVANHHFFHHILGFCRCYLLLKCFPLDLMLPFPACSIVYRWLNQTIPLIFSAVKVLFFMGLILSVLVLLQNQEIASIFALFSIDYPGLTTGIILELCRMLTGFS